MKLSNVFFLKKKRILTHHRHLHVSLLKYFQDAYFSKSHVKLYLLITKYVWKKSTSKNKLFNHLGVLSKK